MVIIWYLAIWLTGRKTHQNFYSISKTFDNIHFISILLVEFLFYVNQYVLTSLQSTVDEVNRWTTELCSLARSLFIKYIMLQCLHGLIDDFGTSFTGDYIVTGSLYLRFYY